MTSITKGGLIRWHITGSLCATVYTTAVTLLRQNPHFDNSYTDYVVESIFVTLFLLVVATPIALAFLWSWLRVSKSIPALEHNALIRYSGLAASTFVFCFLALCVIQVAQVFFLPTEHTADYIWRTVSGNFKDFAYISSFFCVWSIAPRVILPSLRMSIHYQPAASR